MFIVTKLFNIAVNYFDAKKSARYSRMLFVTKLVVRGTQCTVHVTQTGVNKIFKKPKGILPEESVEKLF